MQGTIVKGIGGFYYVKSDSNTIECKARGKFRHNELTPMIGDKVDINVKDGKGVIDKILPRSNQLVRPAVSNITQAFVVFSIKSPDLNADLLNRFLVSCEYNDLKVTVCINKLDLAPLEEETELIDMLNKASYEIIYLRAKEGYGIEKLREKLKDNVTVFCGPSGVGKSTIFNKITGLELMETGEISSRLGRGKHTTRHSELIEIEGGYLVDTPGFSSLELDYIERDNLQFCFPEFIEHINKCKFTGCQHYKEPNCAIKNAVKNGIISNKRYELYVKILEESLNRRDKR